MSSVCVRARARARVCVCVCVPARAPVRMCGVALSLARAHNLSFLLCVCARACARVCINLEVTTPKGCAPDMCGCGPAAPSARQASHLQRPAATRAREKRGEGGRVTARSGARLNSNRSGARLCCRYAARCALAACHHRRHQCIPAPVAFAGRTGLYPIVHFFCHRKFILFGRGNPVKKTARWHAARFWTVIHTGQSALLPHLLPPHTPDTRTGRGETET